MNEVKRGDGKIVRLIEFDELTNLLFNCELPLLLYRAPLVDKLKITAYRPLTQEVNMEFLHEWLPQVWDFMNQYKVLGALIIVAAFCIVAWLVDLVMDRVLRALTRKSKFHLDDVILDILHRPVWLSIVLVGAITGERWISPRPPYDFIFIAVLKSVLVLIWAQAISRVFLRIADDWIRHWREKGRQGSEMIRLGGNIARLVVLVGAIFLFLSFWKINILPGSWFWWGQSFSFSPFGRST
jgi:hypothetical protein